MSRRATHAGSWYTSARETLDRQLDGWLAQVPDVVEGVGNLPVKGGRVIIAPHAGYSYSGPAAAWAYKTLDVSGIKRVFILGPSHHHWTTKCMLTPFTSYDTPLGSLSVDIPVHSQLKETGLFPIMSASVDESEHSIEMHLPYVHKILSLTHPPSSLPTIIPILVGSLTHSEEKQYGRALLPWLRDGESAFVVSSDFCHWGTRFQYTYYIPSAPEGAQPYSLRSNGRGAAPEEPKIWESIEKLDRMGMEAIEKKGHSGFSEYLSYTKNTVCGRHPIGVLMAALEALEKEAPEAESGGDGETEGENVAKGGRFKFVRYEQSSRCMTVRESSVSYASAFAVVRR